MANVANVKVLAGNQVQVSGTAVQLTGSGASLSVSSSQVIVTGTLSASGDVFIAGKLTAREYYTQIVTSSVIYESGSTKFGDTSDDTHQFTGSVYINGLVSSSVGFSGSAAGLTGLVKSVVAGPNISASAPDVNGAVTVRLSSSITSDLTTLTGLTNLSSSTGSFAVLSASTAEISGNLLVYGSAILNSNLTNAAYVKYVAAPEDKIEIFPGLKVSGSTVVSGNLDVTGSVSASSFTGSGAALTNLQLSSLAGASEGKIIIGSGSTFVTASLLAGTGITINSGSGVVSISGSAQGITKLTNTDGNIVINEVNAQTSSVNLSSSVTGLTNLSSNVISGSTVLVTGSLIASGTLVIAQKTVTGSYTVDSDGLDQVIFANAEDAPLTISIPAASDAPGRQLTIKKIDTTVNAVEVEPAGGSIDEPGFESRFIYGPRESITIVSNGVDIWHVI